MIDYESLAPLFHYRTTHSALTDLRITTFGFCDFRRYRDVMRSHIHPHHTIHFILEGEGTYSINDRTFSLKKHSAFYTPPNVPLSYYPSLDKPYIYIWFAFSGSKSEEYIAQYSIHKQLVVAPLQGEKVEDLLHEILQSKPSIFMREETMLAYFFRFIELITQDDEQLREPQVDSLTYVSLAKDFMWINRYNPHLTIEQVAQSIHISHSYLCSIFKQHTGISAKQFLYKNRLITAANLLRSTTQPITEIGTQCGYKDPLYFSSAFKKEFGLSPTAYREKSSTQDKEVATILFDSLAERFPQKKDDQSSKE